MLGYCFDAQIQLLKSAALSRLIGATARSYRASVKSCVALGSGHALLPFTQVMLQEKIASPAAQRRGLLLSITLLPDTQKHACVPL